SRRRSTGWPRAACSSSATRAPTRTRRGSLEAPPDHTSPGSRIRPATSCPCTRIASEDVRVTATSAGGGAQVGDANVLEIDTPHGLARAHLRSAEEPAAALVLGHGAAVGVAAPDLVAVADVANATRFAVALV